MNNNFIKVQRPDKIHSKKGYYWAINPEKRDALDLDIDKSMKKMKAENSCFNHTFRLSNCLIYLHYRKVLHRLISKYCP